MLSFIKQNWVELAIIIFLALFISWGFCHLAGAEERPPREYNHDSYNYQSNEPESTSRCLDRTRDGKVYQYDFHRDLPAVNPRYNSDTYKGTEDD